MKRLLAAVSWSGIDVTLSMFVISSRSEMPQFEPPELEIGPDDLRRYELHDEAGALGGRHVYEYDLVWKELPDDLVTVLTAGLLAALREGAGVAWFGFEGSFDFEYLLHPDVASQIYAVANPDVIRLALDDEYRCSSAWRDFLAEIRERML